jgi:stage IV sporulation protein FB
MISVLTGYFIELITLFCIVVLHELGHVLMAFALGWKVGAVKLLPFGGVVEVEESAGATAYEEILVAIAGPLQNGWMLLLAYYLGEVGWWSVEWTSFFIEANLWIALFNMLPIMPLDGGKIAQALLSCSVSYYSALLWSARISVFISIGVILYALHPVVMYAKGIKLNELMIGLFLLLSNMTTLRHIPFLFYRFMLKRQARTDTDDESARKVFPILTSTSQTLYEGLKRYRRNRSNVLCVIDSQDQPYSLLSEQTVLHHCMQGFNVNRAVGELLR